MKKLLNKFLKFVLVSGVGWVLDFGIFTLLTGLLGWPVVGSNYLSSLVAVTFVFSVSTRKILSNRAEGHSPRVKYLVYVAYQLVLVTAVSFLAQWLHELLGRWQVIAALPILAENTKLLAKILITPITMICNFFVLRQISERW